MEDDVSNLLLKKELPLSSSKRTFANLILCIIGTGILAIPYTFSRVGWLLGTFLLLISGSISFYGMMLIVRSKHRFLKSNAHLFIASYGDLCFHTFGSGGRLMVDILLMLAAVSSGVSYFTFISQNLVSIASAIEGDGVSAAVGSWNPVRASSIGGSGASTGVVSSWNHAQASLASVGGGNLAQETNNLGSFSWTSQWVYVCMIFPLEVALAAIPSITYLAPMSAVGDAMNLCALGAVMVMEVLAVKDVGGPQTVKAIGELLAVPSAFGVGIYAFQSAGMMIPLETAMQEPSKLGALLGCAFVLNGFLYSAFGALGFVAFGAETEQIITLNLQDGVEARLTKGALCVGRLFAFPLMLNPVTEIIERRFSRKQHSLWLRALLVAVICLIAAGVKHFSDFLSLAGSSISSLLVFIIPAAVHLKLIKLECEKDPDMQRQASTLEIASNYFLIVFGLIFGVVGTTISFLDLL